jgi:hypothetical protein
MQNEESIKHGTYAAYTNRKCRCEECKIAAREYMREYRKTESGRARSRLYTQVGTKRNARASAWLKTNRPDVWENICAEISAK